jgi:hypothetical protein
VDCYLPAAIYHGPIVFGKVWRRRDGRHWKYKKFTEFSTDRDR